MAVRLPRRTACLPFSILVLAMTGTVRGEEPARVKEPPLVEADRAHWSFQKPVRPLPPRVKANTWVRMPVDAFIMEKLENAGLKPAPPADRVILLRRVTLDLIGLPPTPEETTTFLSDSSADAFARVVERLLASPHYGERWSQHWLDVIRYAESNGYEADAERPHAWRYRDYVVRAFNEDRPYDRFLTEQLAGDLLAGNKDIRSNIDQVIATGFNRCGPIHLVGGNADPEIGRQEVLTEMTATVASAFLGLTMGCARCHDHKFDPISQADYYRLQAFFAGVQPRDFDIATPEEKALHSRQTQDLTARIAPLRKQVADIEAPYKALLTQLKKTSLEPKYREALDIDQKKRTPEQQVLAGQAQTLIKVTWDEIVDALSSADRARRSALRAQINTLEAELPAALAKAWAIGDDGKPAPTHVLKRGDPKRKGAEVLPAFPRVLATGPDNGPAAPARFDRLALARWLTRPDHPLTARVLVNRIWQHHFGQGLVTTSNDFGLRGELPSHPQLLDWLACEFVAHDWSIKHLHRVLVLSSTYQQASRVADTNKGKEVDPGNRLLWRMNRNRLEGEALRDSVLAVTGTLNRKLGGPVVRVPLEPEVYELIFTEGERDGLWHVTPDPREHCRRSLYLYAKRNVRLPLLEAFDRPDMLTSCPVRPVSTHAPQALILLNGPFMQTQSKAFASRLLRECGNRPDAQIPQAFLLACGRNPRESEFQLARQFLTDQTILLRKRILAGDKAIPLDETPRSIDPAVAAALADFCLAIVNRNDFLYVH